MIRSLLAPFLIAPVLAFGLLGMPIGMMWAGAVAVILLSYVLAASRMDIESGAASVRNLLLQDLESLPYDMPVYLAGVGFGVRPATDWYTAVVDGQRVLILEPVEVPHDPK